MGNLCNGKQSHSKDSLSIKSNESFYYGNSKYDINTGTDGKIISNSSIVCNTIDKNVIAKVIAEDKLPNSVTKNTTYTKSEPIVLDTLNLFPDSIKAILTGYCHFESTPKKIVLFVLSSEPTEFSDEKCILNTTIFSKLKTYANREFFELFLVDLYQESGKQNKKLLDLNQWEFKRQTESAYIIPIIFFNSLLDSEFLLPKILHLEDVNALMSSISEDAGSSLFDTLYEKQSTVFKLREIFDKTNLEAFSKLIINSSDDKIIERFLKVRFNEELQLVFQKNYELQKRVFWITRSFATTSYDDNNIINKELKKRVNTIQTQLKNTIVERNILKIPLLKNSNDKNEFINNSCKILTNLIDNIIDQYKCSTMIRSFHGLETKSIEIINENLKFIKTLTKFSLPRNEIFEKINKYLTSNSNDPLILNGISGSGKTTLIAQIIEYCQNHTANTILIVRFVQISKSASIECILHSILNHCSILLYGKPMPPVIHSLMVFKNIFEKYLEDFSKLKKSIIILLDGVDQVSERVLLDDWLPEKFTGINIKIIVTLNENYSEKFKNNFEIPVLSHDKIAIWSSDNENLLDISEQIIQLVKEFELKNGKDRTEILFNYFIAYGKFGLTENEIFDLLLAENLFDRNWSIIQEFYLEFIQFFDLFLNWFQSNGYYLAAIKSDLHLNVLRTYYQNYKHLYQQIYNYYNDKKSHDLSMNNEWFQYRKHEMLSILAEYIDNKSYIESKYVCDVEEIFEKLKIVNCCKVLDDFKRIGSEHNYSLIQKNFQKFLEKYAFQLNYDSWQFYGCLNEFLQEYDAELDPKIEILVKNSPITSLILLKETTDSENILSGRFDRIIRFKNNEDFIIGICSSKNEVCVWNIEQCKPVRILRGITNPTNVLDIDQYKCVILSNRELKIFNLNEGKLLTKLKGVMNQKMPFYGLHDDKHVVALSRNRMYVNLMNIETGDCLTTFKAGEDRFLNSLLISGNGQILVCGDETQKPFPLLVWNLKSRKLLYDLRIPHHDFVTRLSAITYDGNFMCCVCHEINEPNPNFIVVYDLQSGTLFKKWKPNYNTVSIEISSQSCCVLSGLENAQIYIWDLTTGNCRWRLCGHTAPVTDLRLDPHGVLCLSRNVSAHDLSIRIWDLKTGELFAVYTPTSSIIDCEITTGYVLMIVENSNKPITLKIIGQNHKYQSNKVQSYELEGNNGKIFDIVD